VSTQFVLTQLKRLGWVVGQLSPEDWSGALSTFRIGIIPDDFLTQRGVQVRIHKSVEVLIDEGAVTDQDLRRARTLDNLPDGECEDPILKHTALSLTEDPEVEECEITLATAITDIESVLLSAQIDWEVK
jgi:hypothetical protein